MYAEPLSVLYSPYVGALSAYYRLALISVPSLSTIAMCVGLTYNFYPPPLCL